MLNPLNIAPAAGQRVAPSSDPLTSRDQNARATTQEGETFESILTADSEAAEAPEDATHIVEATEVDPTDELVDADFSGDQDQVPALPDADDADEITELFDGRREPSYPADDGLTDDGRLSAGQGDSDPDDSIRSDHEWHGDDINDISPFPRDRATGDLSFLNIGNDNRGLKATRPHAPQPVSSDTPAVAGLRTAADRPGLAREIIPQAPVVLTTQGATTDESAPMIGARQAQPLAGVALSQRAKPAIAVQTETQSIVYSEKPQILPDPDQALAEKPVIENSQPVSRQPVPAMPVLRLAEGGPVGKDAGNIPERSKESTGGNRLMLSDRSTPTPPALTPGTNANTPAANFAPINTGLVEVQQESGRVNWISETGVLGDTGKASDATTLGRTPLDSVFRTPDLPRHIAAQIAHVAERGGGGKPVELHLNPHELGRVKISMVSHDGTMNVNVIADRAETLDLMRRHIDVLAQEFLDVGYGQADFAFGQNTPENGDNSDQHAPDGSPQMISHPEDPLPSSGAITALPIITDHVDIRL